MKAVWPWDVPHCRNIFLKITIGVPGSIFRGQSCTTTTMSERKTVTMKPMKKAVVKVFDHTPIRYLLSTELASCNLENGFRRFVPHIIRNYNQLSTPEKENAHRHSLQSFALILLQKSFVSGIVKKRALKQNKASNIMFSEMKKIVVTLKMLGLSEIGQPRFKPFYPNW